VPWRDLFQGALVGGVGLSLLKISAAAVLPRLTANPLFASFAIVVGLLVWLNLIARLILISTGWAANDLDEIRGGEFQAQIQAFSQAPRPRACLGRRPSVTARCRPSVRGPETVRLWDLASSLVSPPRRPREHWPAVYGPWFASVGVESQLSGACRRWCAMPRCRPGPVRSSHRPHRSMR
jgi:hypothetical protein